MSIKARIERLEALRRAPAGCSRFDESRLDAGEREIFDAMLRGQTSAGWSCPLTDQEWDIASRVEWVIVNGQKVERHPFRVFADASRALFEKI